MNNHTLRGLLAACLLGIPALAPAADYDIDTKGAHAFVQFHIKHLGYSWLVGRFNQFAGEFRYDENNPAAASVSVTIDTASVDSNHAERDKHLRNADFLEVDKYPEARFVSTAYRPTGDDTGVLEGQLTLHGVTRPVSIEVTQIGAGPDPWGGYRRGFEGRTTLTLADYNIRKNLGPASQEVHLWLGIEGIRR